MVAATTARCKSILSSHAALNDEYPEGGRATASFGLESRALPPQMEGHSRPSSSRTGCAQRAGNGWQPHLIEAMARLAARSRPRDPAVRHCASTS